MHILLLNTRSRRRHPHHRSDLRTVERAHTADDCTIFVQDVSDAVHLLAYAIDDISFEELSNGVALLVKDKSPFVDFETF